MARPVPSLYLLHGSEPLAIDEFVARLTEKLGDPGAIALNLQSFTPETLDLSALEHACAAAPFLAPRRLIVVRHCGAALVREAARRERFLALLGALPPTTALVLIEPAESPAVQVLTRWAEEHPQAALVRAFEAPRGAAFARWIVERARRLGGEIDPPAAHLLAELVADDPRRADLELAKLLDYVDRRRPVRPDDVEQLTPFRGQSDVFGMVDALGEGRAREAQALLHRLLEDESPRYAFAMIVRQFRLLLRARYAEDRGHDPVATLSLHPFVARKVASQARRFETAALEAAYHRLLETDLQIKTSQVAEEVALDTLIAGLALSV